MEQQVLFEDEFIRHRNSDPETSKEAAKTVSDFSAMMYQRIATELYNGEGTYEELADRMGAGKDQLCKRLPEMQRLGIIELTGALRTGSSGRKQRVWRIV